MIVNGVVEPDLSPADGVYFNRPGIAMVRWDGAFDAVHVRWHGCCDSAEFASLSNAGLSALRQHHGWRWLADCRNLQPINRSDQEWFDRDWFPRAVSAGLKRMALVLENLASAPVNVEQMLTRAPGTRVEFCYFQAVEAAADWLSGPAVSSGSLIARSRN